MAFGRARAPRATGMLSWRRSGPSARPGTFPEEDVDGPLLSAWPAVDAVATVETIFIGRAAVEHVSP